MVKNIDELRKAIGQYKGITADSRLVEPGFIFVAVKGLSSDGHDFIGSAIKNGAEVVVGECGLNLPNYIKVDDSREALGELASKFYGHPSQKLKIIGVTGTKGKTTTCHIIYHILTKLGKKAGLLSSISVPGLHVTSPDVVYLHKSLKEFVDKGFEYAVIEVSSHGIDQKRIAGVKFDVGVLTNIAPEHLDYHKTFKEYKQVKMSFIKSAKNQVIAPKDTEINILPGKFNNLDIEAAVEALEKLGFNRLNLLEAAKTFVLPEGRLTEVPNGLGFKIFIDFAHTPDSLEAVLTYLRSQTKGRLISVFGCAGERDKRKRFQMGKVSAKLSDASIFTAEDPRSEDVYKIMSKMREGARSIGRMENKTFFRIPERGEAIVYALSIAQEGDVVGIFGKGHEKSMAYKGFEHQWNDRQMVEDWLSRDQTLSAIVLAAGKGTRMMSSEPKVLKEICGRPMIAYTLENLRKAGIGEIVAVLSYRKNLVIKEIVGTVKVAYQKDSKGGTGQATKCGLELVGPDNQYILVFYGDDSAFFKPETIRKAINEHIKDRATVSFASAIVENPFGLGRVLRNSSGEVLGIVEEKAANDEQKKIDEINCGNFIFNKDWLTKNIDKLEKSASGEYYINNLVQAAIDQGQKVMAYKLKDRSEWQGINTPEQLAEANKKMAARLVSN